jgi:hypothetical protein
MTFHHQSLLYNIIIVIVILPRTILPSIKAPKRAGVLHKVSINLHFTNSLYGNLCIRVMEKRLGFLNPLYHLTHEQHALATISPKFETV